MEVGRIDDYSGTATDRDGCRIMAGLHGPYPTDHQCIEKSWCVALIASGIRNALTIVWIVLAAAGVLAITGVASEFSFLTISGIVGLTASLALQSTLSNVISGVLLLSDRVLRLDDSIAFSGVRGVVVKIGLRSTWIRTEAGEIAIVSNSNLMNGPFVNFTVGEQLDRKLRV